MRDIFDEKAVAAKTNENALNELVRENNSFILCCASKTCRRYITQSDDEYEVALVAFCEAVRAFDADAGGFMGFAALVIRRWLMDYFDKQSRRSNEISAGSAMCWDEDVSMTSLIILRISDSVRATIIVGILLPHIPIMMIRYASGGIAVTALRILSERTLVLPPVRAKNRPKANSQDKYNERSQQHNAQRGFSSFQQSGKFTTAQNICSERIPTPSAKPNTSRSP